MCKADLIALLAGAQFSQDLNTCFWTHLEGCEKQLFCLCSCLRWFCYGDEPLRSFTICNTYVCPSGLLYLCVCYCTLHLLLQKPGTCLRLFQRSVDEDSNSCSDQDEVPGLRDSCLTNTKCVLLQLQYTTHDRHSDSRNKDVANNSTEIAARKEILQNLARQIAAKHREDGENEPLSGSTSESRKRASPPTLVLSRENGASPPKASRCSTDPDLPSLSHTLTTPCQSVSRTEGANTQSVSKPAAGAANLPALCCDRSVDCQTALPGFFSPPPPLGHTNNRLTPRNALTCFLSTSTPASQSRIRASRGPIEANHNSCLLTPIADENSSMSPITRSTQKMSKAMQVSCLLYVMFFVTYACICLVIFWSYKT